MTTSSHIGMHLDPTNTPWVTHFVHNMVDDEGHQRISITLSIGGDEITFYSNATQLRTIANSFDDAVYRATKEARSKKFDNV